MSAGKVIKSKKDAPPPTFVARLFPEKAAGPTPRQIVEGRRKVKPFGLAGKALKDFSKYPEWEPLVSPKKEEVVKVLTEEEAMMAAMEAEAPAVEETKEDDVAGPATTAKPKPWSSHVPKQVRTKTTQEYI